DFASAGTLTAGGTNFYIYVAGPDVAGNWDDNNFRANALQTILMDYYGRPGLSQPDILLTYTTFDIGQTFSAFYVPLQNDIRGIGYKHQEGLHGPETLSGPRTRAHGLRVAD